MKKILLILLVVCLIPISALAKDDALGQLHQSVLDCKAQDGELFLSVGEDGTVYSLCIENKYLKDFTVFVDNGDFKLIPKDKGGKL